MSFYKKHGAYGATALALIAILFLGITILATFLLRGWRVDLTESRLYTIAPGTKHILSSLDEPINLYFFFSDEPSRSVPAIRAYAQRVRELLEEMSQRSHGKLKLKVIDPKPFSDDEDRANSFGLTGVPTGSAGESLYFGLAGTNSTDGRQTIIFFQPEKEEFLEYDVASLIYKLAHPKRPVVGLMTSLPMDAGFDPMTGQMRQGWTIVSQLREMFDVRTIAPQSAAIEKGIDVLFVVHPKDLSPQSLYAIDQFVLRGGKLFAFVDPDSQEDMAGGGPMGGFGAKRSSTLGPLFDAWDIEYDPNKVVGDQRLAMTVSLRQGQTPSRHVGILALTRDNFDRKDVLTATLDSINVMTAGAIRLKKDSKLSFEPLIQSSNQAELMDSSRFAMISDSESLLDGFKATGERYTIAARVRGKLKTAFPNGAPAAPQGEAAAPGEPQIKESASDANIVIVADTDMLADPLWLRTQNLFGQRFAIAWANNGDFVSNALDNLAGSTDLISIRGRQSFFRPFTRVDAIRQRADERLRAKEQELNRELRETERKLSDLQAGRSDKSSHALTSAQEAELARFQSERARIRHDLREVKRSLDVDIDRLGTVLKVINIGLMPVVITFLTLWIAARRRRELKAARSSAAPAPAEVGA